MAGREKEKKKKKVIFTSLRELKIELSCGNFEKIGTKRPRKELDKITSEIGKIDLKPCK